jgi:hypothetical protein
MRQAVNWLRLRLLTRENLWALTFCLILVLLVIATAGVSPLWIYQGF